MVGLIITLILIVLAVVGQIQIITKAGYSPWWILLPLSLPLLWLIALATTFADLSQIGAYGTADIQAVVAEAKILAVVAFLDLLANFAMFLVFAFSDWPVMQAARRRNSPSGGGFHRPHRPVSFDPGAGVAQVRSQLAGFPNVEGQPPGWYKSGPIGAGEESYWDGSTWTARRQWSGGDWVDLPMPQPEQVGPDGAPPPQAYTES